MHWLPGLTLKNSKLSNGSEERLMKTAEIMDVKEIAEILGTSPMKVKSGILNGTMPIGTVLSEGGRDRTIIIRARWEAWINAKDLGA